MQARSDGDSLLDLLLELVPIFIFKLFTFLLDDFSGVYAFIDFSLNIVSWSCRRECSDSQYTS